MHDCDPVAYCVVFLYVRVTCERSISRGRGFGLCVDRRLTCACTYCMSFSAFFIVEFLRTLFFLCIRVVYWAPLGLVHTCVMQHELEGI